MGSRTRLNMPVWLLLGVVASAVAVPISRHEGCARHCAASNRFQFLPGTTYTYDYDTSTTTVVKGTSKEKSQLQMRAQVDIEVLSKCDLSLRLRGVTLRQTDPQSPDYLTPIKGGKDFSKAVEEQVLTFSWQDGRVEDICPSEGAPSWVTNIQRGVLSALQNSMESLDKDERIVESDVAGKCPVEYRSLGRSWRGVLRIHKLKDLNSCTDRHSTDTALQATPFTQGSTIQSHPLVSGSQECEQSIGDRIVQSSSCVEKHVFRPFSKGDGGVTTTVHQKLTFAANSKRSFTGNDYRPTREGLLFNHETEKAGSTSSINEAETTMKVLCQASKNDITITVPEKFASFIYKLKKLDYNSLGSFYRRVDSLCPDNAIKAKKFFMDAIPVVATAASVRFMSEMIMRQEVSNAETDFWLTSLSFVTEPTPEMIASLTPLLDGRYEQALLGVSSLVHTFCKASNCGSVPEVRVVVHKLVENIGENCFNPDVKKILLTLKAIANIGQPFGRERILERCYNNPQLKIEVRLAAIQAFRRFSCDVSRESFLKTYNNYNEGSEIRIASYLAAMKCMTIGTLQEVKGTLEREKVNQVGSFVWTHLQALAKSRHPERQIAKEIVSNLYLLNKYHSDIRKFSSAHEASFYLDSINSGLHVDTHLIFPTHSYLPHSASLNLTVDIFGHSCNLFQLDGRMEGVEQVMEKFFGPSGYFPQKHVSKLLRDRRSIADNKIDRMDAQFDAKSKFEEKPYGSLDVKIFGNTLWYNQFEESEKGQAASNLIDIVAELAQKQETEFSRSIMFLDTTYSIPMASGLPLRLAVNGTASVNLKLGGRFNVRSMQSVDILAHVEPSGAVQFAGLLTVEAGNVGRTGMRIAATLHSSTVLDTKFEVRNGEIIKAEVNVPRERIDIVDLQTRLYLVYGSDEREAEGQVENGFRKNSCTPSDSVKRILGVELCADIQLPGGKSNTPIYPMNGPSVVSLYLKKVDSTLTKYAFDAAWENKLVSGKIVRQGSISFNTPQSKIDREVKMHFYLNQPDGTFSFEAKTPVRKVGVKAKYINTFELRKLDMSLSVDDKDQFSMHSELRTKSEKSSVSYFPTLEISIPSKKLVAVSGSAHLKYGQKYGAQLMITDLTERPITLKGQFDMKEKKRFEGEVTISSYALDTTVKAILQKGDTIFTKISADYKIMDGKTYKFKVDGKVRDLSAHSLRKYTGVLNVQATAFPEWDTSVSWETMQTAGHLENSFSFVIGDGVKTRAHTITFEEIVKYRGHLYDNSVEVALKLTYPEKNINYALQMKHENTGHSLKNALEIQYALNRQISYTTMFSYEPDKLLNGECSLKYPGREAKVTVELTQESNPKEYKGSTTIQWQHGKRMSVMTHYRDRSDGSRTKHEAEVEVIVPYRAPITLSGSFGVHREEYSGFVEINNGLEKYRVNADYFKSQGFDHRFSGMLLLPSGTYSLEESLESGRDKVTGMAELKLSSRRRISTKFEVKSSKYFKTGTFETSWDADRDPTKKFGFNGDLRTNSNGFDTKFNIQVQRKNIRGSISANSEGELNGTYFKAVHQAEIEWTPRQKASLSFSTNTLSDGPRQQISSRVEVKTPFRGYETTSLSLNHFNFNQEWNSDMMAVWADNKKFSISSGGKYSLSPGNTLLDADLKVQNPWLRHEILTFNISHYQNEYQLSNKMQLNWSPRERISTEISHFITETGFKGKVKVMTPFRNAHDIHAEINHSYASGTYKTKVDTQWANRQKISVEMDLKHVLSGRRRLCSTNLIVTTPFDSYEYVSSKVVYNDDGTTESADGEINWNNKKITAGMMKINRNAYYSKNMEGKVYFTSPFNGYRDLQLVSSLQVSQDNFKVNFNTKLPFSMSTSFNSIGKLISLQNFEFNAVLDGEFNNYINFQKLSIDVVHKYQNSNARSSFDGIYNDKQITILFTGMMRPGYKSQNMEGSLSAKTPFNDYKDITIDFSHDRRDLECTTKLQYRRNRHSVALVHNANIKNALNFETDLALSSSFRNNQVTAKYTAIQIYNEGYLTHKSVAEWGPKGKTEKMELHVQYDDKISGKDIQIKFLSPYEQLQHFELSGHHEQGHGNYMTKVTTLWNDNGRFHTEIVFRNYAFKKINSDLNIKSSPYGSLQYGLRARYDSSHPNKVVEAHWHKQGKQIASLIAKYIMNKNSPELMINLNTPFENMERISFTGKTSSQPGKHQLTVIYENNNVKTEFNSKLSMSSTSGSCEVSFTSPFRFARTLKASASYSNLQDELYREIFVQWAEDKKLSAIGKYSRLENGFDTKLTLATPFSNYEAMSLDASAEIGQKNIAQLILRRNNDKIELLAECQVTKDTEGKFRVQLSSPFDGFRTIEAQSSYMKIRDGYQAQLTLDCQKGRTYKGEIQMLNAEKFNLKLFLQTPHYPYRTIEFLTELKNEDGLQLNSYLKWENKKMEMSLTRKLDLDELSIDLQVSTPFESFKRFSTKGSLRISDISAMDGKIEIVTSFTSLPKLIASGTYKLDNEFCDFKITSSIPNKMSLDVSGQITNNPRKPFQGSLNVHAPFANLDNVVLKTKIDYTKGWSNCEAEFNFITPNSEHTLTTNYNVNSQEFSTAFNIQSPLLSGNRMSVGIQATYGDVQIISTYVTCDVFGEQHVLEGKYQHQGYVSVFDIRISSPALSKGKAFMRVSYTQRRRVVEGSAIIGFPDSQHSITVKGETGRTQSTASIKIECPLLAPTPIEVTGKYVNGNGKDLELSLTADTPGAKHTVIANLKNYDGDKFLQLEVDCPLLEVKQASITATLKYDGYEAVDSVLTMSARREEIRIAGNMKSSGWNNMEGFLIFNTPFKQLRMLRIDTGFKNQDFKNLEANLQVQSSNPNLHAIGFTGKVSRGFGSEDLSLVMHLPSSYKTIQFLGNLHYEPDLSSADTKVTLTLAPYRYSIYGSYQAQKYGLSLDGEMEYEANKYSFSSQAKLLDDTKGATISLRLPSRGSYTAGALINSVGGRKSLSVSYGDPYHSPLNISVAVDYDSPSNINAALTAITPFDSYNRVNARVRYQREGRRLIFTDVEYTTDEQKGFLNILHRLNHTNYLCTIRIGSPYRALKDFEITIVKARSHESKLDIIYNGYKYLGGEMSTIRGVNNYLLNLPAFPMTISSKLRPTSAGHELVVRSKYPTRTMSLNIVGQDTPSFWSQDVVFVWDESTHRQISYSLKTSNSPKGQPWGKELFARLNFPLRSLELKGKLTESGKVRSGGMDFYWDANKDTAKHFAVGIEHQDLSSRVQTSHKLQFTLIHPTLPKDLEINNVLTVSATEFFCRSELQYSRHQERHLVAELKANNLLPHNRDTHYKAEMSLRHPISQLDVRVTGEAINNDAESIAEIRLNNVDRKRRSTVYELKTKIQKMKQQIDIMMRANSDRMSIMGKKIDRNGETTIELKQKINGEPALQSFARLDRGLRSIDFNVSYTDEKGMNLAASCQHDEATFRLQHFNSLGTYTDISAYLGLERSRILRSKATWKPGMWRDMRIATGNTLRGFSHFVSRLAQDCSTEIRDEYKYRSQQVGIELKSKLQPFWNSISRGFEEIRRDCIKASNLLSAMYQNNEFFSKDIVNGVHYTRKVLRDLWDVTALFAQMLSDLAINYLEEAFENLYYDLEDLAMCIKDFYANTVSGMYRLATRTATMVKEGFKSACDGITYYMSELGAKLSEMAIRTQYAMEDYLSRYAPFIIDGYYYIRITTDNIRYNIENAVNSFVTSVTTHPIYVAVNDYFIRVVDTIKTFQAADLVSTVQSRVLFMGQNVNVFLNRLMDVQVVDFIRNRIPIDYLADTAKRTFQKGAEIYTTLGLDKMAKNLLFYTWEHAKSLAMSSGQEFLHEFYQLKTGAKYTLDTKRGLFSFEYTLPSSKSSIYEVLQISRYPEYRKLGEFKKMLIAKYYEDFCIWDTYYKVKNFFSSKYWMPPFTAHAMIAGNQHYVTFDKLAFDFAGECSYLLARDFVDGNFTIVANYKREHSRAVRKSLTVQLDDTRFELVNDYRLSLNGIKVELPIRVGRTVAIREGANVRIENDHKGFVVICNFIHDVCTVGMSGFYFAKTGGLFGTYDYEPNLDMMTPEKSIASDVEAFVNSWEVGQTSCRSTSNLATIPGNDYRVQERCKAIFAKTSSPFRACFKQVDPEAYLNMCISDLSSVHENQFDSAICTSAAAYFTECRVENVQLKMPKACVRCETTDGRRMIEGDVAKFTRENPTHAADIVFVVEEKKCNEENFKYLSRLAHIIEDNFRQKGFLDIRYRVVGFGGPDIHAKPHIHTVDGQEYGNIRSIDTAISSLQIGEGPVNMLEALRFAASLDFRPGTSKNFILLKCSTCKSEEGKAEYGEMLRTLQDGDINLHLLMEQKYEMRIANKNSKAKKVIGLDKNFAYTLKDIKDSNVFGDGDLLIQLKVPKDICIPLALEGNGSTFDSQYLTETKRNTYKKFMDVMARRMVKSAVQMPPGKALCCECIATADGVGKSTCQRCVSEHVAKMITDDSTVYYAPGRYNRESNARP